MRVSTGACGFSSEQHVGFRKRIKVKKGPTEARRTSRRVGAVQRVGRQAEDNTVVTHAHGFMPIHGGHHALMRRTRGAQQSPTGAAVVPPPEQGEGHLAEHAFGVVRVGHPLWDPGASLLHFLLLLPPLQGVERELRGAGRALALLRWLHGVRAAGQGRGRERRQWRREDAIDGAKKEAHFPRRVAGLAVGDHGDHLEGRRPVQVEAGGQGRVAERRLLVGHGTGGN